MIDVAEENGITRRMYRERIRSGWSPKRAATERINSYKGEFAVYKRGEMVVMGSAEECAEVMGVKVSTIKWMATPAIQKRVEKMKNPEMATTAVRID